MTIEICKNHTGKMEKIQSISTSVLLNSFCQNNRKKLGSVCSHCYAENLANMYSALAARLARNTEVLTSGVIPWDLLPTIETKVGEETIFRFEAFGDIINETQLYNYYMITRKNPFVRFSLYTKRYSLVTKFFEREDIDVPPNLTIVFSSLMLNTPIDINKLKGHGMFRKGQIKSFTVYSKDYIMKHPELKINCGARCCNTCRLCYLKNEVEEIREILKTDREATERFLAFKDPEVLAKTVEDLEEFELNFDE